MKKLVRSSLNIGKLGKKYLKWSKKCPKKLVTEEMLTVQAEIWPICQKKVQKHDTCQVFILKI